MIYDDDAWQNDDASDEKMVTTMLVGDLDSCDVWTVWRVAPPLNLETELINKSATSMGDILGNLILDHFSEVAGKQIPALAIFTWL